MKKYLLGWIKYLFYDKVSLLSFITVDSILSKKVKINRLVRVYRSSIGNYTYIAHGTSIVNTTVGRFCSIAGDCKIGLGSHTMNNISTSPIFTEINNGTGFSWSTTNVYSGLDKRIVIGNDVWIGSRVIILSGVIIGDGAIIGAGSIVTKDVPPYAVVAGVPAKIIKYRFDQNIINKLLEIQWWNFSDKHLRSNILLFQNGYVSIDLLNKFDFIQ